MAGAYDPYNVRAKVDADRDSLRVIVRGRVGWAWLVLAPLWPLVYRAIRAAAPAIVARAELAIWEKAVAWCEDMQAAVRRDRAAGKISPGREFCDGDRRSELNP